MRLETLGEPQMRGISISMMADTPQQSEIGGGPHPTEVPALHVVQELGGGRAEQLANKMQARSERMANLGVSIPAQALSREEFFGIVEYPREKFELAERNFQLGAQNVMRAIDHDFVIDAPVFHRGHGVKQPYVSFDIHHGSQTPDEHTLQAIVNWSEIGGMNIGVDGVPVLLPPEQERKGIKSANPLRNGEMIDFTKPLEVVDAEMLADDPRSTELVTVDLVTTPSKVENIESLISLAATPSLVSQEVEETVA